MAQKVQSPAFTMRVLKFAFIASVVMFFYIVVTLPAAPKQPLDPKVGLLITILALTNIAFGFGARRLVDRPARAAASTPLKRWMTAGVLSLAFFESCPLFGLALHFLGATLRHVEILFAAGLLSMLFWSPGSPPPAENADLIRS